MSTDLPNQINRQQTAQSQNTAGRKMQSSATPPVGAALPDNLVGNSTLQTNKKNPKNDAGEPTQFFENMLSKIQTTANKDGKEGNFKIPKIPSKPPLNLSQPNNADSSKESLTKPKNKTVPASKTNVAAKDPTVHTSGSTRKRSHPLDTKPRKNLPPVALKKKLFSGNPSTRKRGDTPLTLVRELYCILSPYQGTLSIPQRAVGRLQSGAGRGARTLFLPQSNQQKI